ncbi:hypothetical protein D3C77_295440 [compost metagenome]
MHQPGKTLAVSGHGPLQHLQVAVGVAKRQDRSTTNDSVDADRLARAIIVVEYLGQALDGQRALVVVKARVQGRADHLLRGNAIDLFSERPHESDFAARDDISLKAIGAQVLEQLQHRLEDHLGVRLLGFWVNRRGEPASGLGDKRLGADTGVSRGNNFQQAIHTACSQGLVVTFKDRLERLLGFPLWVLRGQALDFIQGKLHLEVHWLLAPQGAVIVEHRDAFSHRHIILAAFYADGADKLLDGLARGPVVPGRQRVPCLHQKRYQHQQTEQPTHLKSLKHRTSLSRFLVPYSCESGVQWSQSMLRMCDLLRV